MSGPTWRFNDTPVKVKLEDGWSHTYFAFSQGPQRVVIFTNDAMHIFTMVCDKIQVSHDQELLVKCRPQSGAGIVAAAVTLSGPHGHEDNYFFKIEGLWFMPLAENYFISILLSYPWLLTRFGNDATIVQTWSISNTQSQDVDPGDMAYFDITVTDNANIGFSV
ncbi:hypothetical protein BDV97DRAFT_373285 [Delphinella strobiligena]|nr:hypothetical protein BDV97DRAFT_373285 [Delphinella strobiligena]